MDLPLADDETLRRAAGLVEALAAHHGLSEVRLGQHGGELVVTVGAGRDYFDLVRFEMELENLASREGARGVQRSTRSAGTRAAAAGQRRGVSESDALLGFALEAVDESDVLVGHGRHECAASLDRQRALAFCWIAVGSALKDYTRSAQLPARQEPLSSPIRFRDRLAHQALSQPFRSVALFPSILLARAHPNQ